MKPNFTFAIVLGATLLTGLGCHIIAAQVPGSHDHQRANSVTLGRVKFQTSCNAEAQKQFNLAIAWLHSFEYENAEKVFTEVTAKDPKCALGYWGIAMSNYHPLWAPPTASELQKGWAAIAKARSTGARTEREWDYVGALEQFYKDADKLDHRTRVLAYTDAMERLYKRHPSDHEAGVFYSLALIAKGMIAGDKSYPNEKKAAEILNRVLASEPEHPGVAHYLIHSYDYPALAYLALDAARSYAKIAPSSAHARHMPSHIFTRQGLWEDAIQSNLNARAAAKDYAVRNKMAGAWDEELHAMDYLVYAYLQGAQDKKALNVLEDLSRIRRVDPPNLKVAYSFTAIPARYALERRQWSDAGKLAFPPTSLEAFPWERFRWAEAHIHFARAIGSARSGNTAAARMEVQKLGEIQNSLVAVKGDYDWAKQVEIGRQIAAAWLAYAEGKPEEALRSMSAAAELDDATDKHPVTPSAVLPAREQLGELLLELKQPAAAFQEFETSLRSAPNRFNGIYGAARSAQRAGDKERATTYYKKLIDLGRLADSGRPELEEARQFLANSHKASAL